MHHDGTFIASFRRNAILSQSMHPNGIISLSKHLTALENVFKWKNNNSSTIQLKMWTTGINYQWAMSTCTWLHYLILLPGLWNNFQTTHAKMCLNCILVKISNYSEIPSTIGHQRNNATRTIDPIDKCITYLLYSTFIDCEICNYTHTHTHTHRTDI